MKKTELENILKKAQVPEISGGSIEAFSRQVVARLGRPGRVERSSPDRSFRWGQASAFAICVIVVIGVVRWQSIGKLKTKEASDFVANVELIRQTMGMFPNRVRAIVDDGHGLNLVLSENADVPSTPPIYVRICDGISCSSMVTFSGQEIQVAGRKLTVLSGAGGEIILAGDQFIWSSSKQFFAGNHLKIEAKTFGPTIL